MFKKTSLILFVIVLISFISGKLISQNTWSLEDCIAHAMQHNIEIKKQVLTEQHSRYNVEQSYANFLPNLNAQASQGFSFGRSVDPFTNEFSTERIMRQNAGASSALVLFNGFQNVNYLRQNLLRHTAIRYDTERLQNDVTLTIAAAYMQILFNEDFVENARQQTEVISQQLERTRALHQGGTLPRSNVLEMEARLAEEELNLINAKNNLRLSYLELVQLLDLDPTQEFAIEKPDMDIQDHIVVHEPQAVYQKALQIEPSVQSASSRIQVAKRQIALERGRMSPSIVMEGSLGTGYSEASQMLDRQEAIGTVQIGHLADDTPVFGDGGTRNFFKRKPYSDQIRDNFSQYVGINIRIPIFNRLDVRTRVQQSQIDLDIAQNNYELTRNNLNKAIHQAHADALASYQKYQATTKSLEAFRESFEYTSQRYNLGMVSSVEYNESQMRLARAQREVIQAKYDFIFKTKIMEFYMGQGFQL